MIYNNENVFLVDIKAITCNVNNSYVQSAASI